MTKASELDKGLKISDPSAPDDEDRSYYLPPQRIPVYKAYKKVGLPYERTVHDRVWDWWISLVTADPVSQQELRKIIPQLYRIKDSATDKEYIFYNVELQGNDWKGNRKDFSYIEGLIEGMPVFNYEIEASTNKIIAGTTQVLEVKREFSIPWSKEEIDKISKNFRNPLSCIVIAQDGRKYSVNLEQFKSTAYSEIIDIATGLSDFFKNRRGQKVYS